MSSLQIAAIGCLIVVAITVVFVCGVEVGEIIFDSVTMNAKK